MNEVNFDYMKDLDVPVLDGMKRVCLDKFVRQKWTNHKQEDIWIKNYKENKDKLKPSAKSHDGAKKACILVGSSPAIKRQVNALKKISDDFILISSNGAYKFLLDNDIIPDYVMVIEGRDHVVGDVSEQKNGTKLITSPFVDPKIIENWQGDYLTYMVGGGDKFTPIIEQDWDEIDIGGGNVINCALCWAYKYLMCNNFILIGVSLCFYDDYYVDGRSTEHVIDDFDMIKGFYKATDMYGEIVNTTLPLLMYKTWLETYSKEMKIDLVNSTEDGILGVYPIPITKDKNGINFKLGHVPWINIAPLSIAIEAFKQKFSDLGGK